MKNKIFGIIFLIFITLVLFACKKKDTEEPASNTFKSDGAYLAYNITKTDNPTITYVNIIIENDKVKSIGIDEVQATTTDNVLTFNELTKKNMKYDYKMHYNDYTTSLTDDVEESSEGYQKWLKDNKKLEWFEQVDLIEKDLLTKYNDIVTDENYEFKVNSVTIETTNFTSLMKEAYEQAKNGKLKAFVLREDDVIMGTADVNNKVVSNYKIDMLQGTMSPDNVFSFNEKTKRELGYLYHMHYFTYIATLEDSSTGTEDGYKAWLKANKKLEWFEQVDVLASEYEKNLDIKINESGNYTNTELASVTIHDNDYITVMNLLKSYGK